MSSSTPPPLDFGKGSMFDLIAHRYDFINRVLALQMDIGWRRHMTHEIHEWIIANEGQGSLRLLDVATGTADVAIQLAKEFQTRTTTTSANQQQQEKTVEVTILGLDPSPNMLNVGRTKISSQNLDEIITLEVADARDLSKYYPTSSSSATDSNSNNNSGSYYDAATISFGIRNVVPGRLDALCEIHKLLKPNEGILAVLEFSEPTYEDDGILGWLAQKFIRHVVPYVGAFLSGGYTKEYLHLQNSIKDFPTPNEFKHQLQTLDCDVGISGSGKEQEGRRGGGGGYFDMEDVQSMNFGSVHLYLGRAKTRKKHPKLPPIVPKYEVTPLHTASAHGDIETVRTILGGDGGSDGDSSNLLSQSERLRLVNAKDTNGWSPLNEAVRNGSYDVVQLLVLNGADVNSRTGRPLTDDFETGPSILYTCIVDYNMPDDGTNPIIQLLKDHGAKSIPPGAPPPDTPGDHVNDEL